MGKKWLLSCDVDGTLLLPHKFNPGLEDFNRFVETRRADIVFVLNSGRNVEHMSEIALHGPVTRPDFLICAIGAEIHEDFSGRKKDSEWQRISGLDWGRKRIRKKLSRFPGLSEQESIHQRPSKLSYYIDDPVDIENRVRLFLQEFAPFIKISVCQGYYLDILPVSGGKGGALEFLSRRLGLDRHHVLAAGDSGNDLDMLDRGFRSIIVSNQTGELDCLRGGDSVYFSPLEAAEGVMDGLRYFGLY